MFIPAEGFGRFAFDTFGHFDTAVVRLLGFDNFVDFHRFVCVGTRLPPRYQAVGRLGQSQERDIFVDIFCRCHSGGT